MIIDNTIHLVLLTKRLLETLKKRKWRRMDIHIIANKTLQRSWITPGRRQLFHWFVSLVPAIHQMLIGHLTIQPTRARTLASVLQKKSDKMRRRARRVQIQVP